MTEKLIGFDAWLHRRGRPSWKFEPNPKYGELVHVTRNGGVYAILAGHKYVNKPFWVARRVNGFWCTVERELRVREIEFENGGRYLFPVSCFLREKCCG